LKIRGIIFGHCCLSFFLLTCTLSHAQNVTFTTRVVIHGLRNDAKSQSHNFKNVVLWLTPLDKTAPDPESIPANTHYRLVQHDKQFEPHILVVPVGAFVEFPNHDPYFHNVFSLFEGKRFDLGLYEGGTTRKVRFDKPGISYIFCNIHAQMSAVVVSLATPYYGISNEQGEISVPNVPVGRYKLHVWYEEAPNALQAMTREITISQEDSTIPTLSLQTANIHETHKNKFGQDYEPPQPASPAYELR
jgi:plastocyanin